MYSIIKNYLNTKEQPNLKKQPIKKKKKLKTWLFFFLILYKITVS